MDDRLGRLRPGRRPRLPLRAADDGRLLDPAAALRGEGTGLYNLSRNIGSSVGISVVTALLTQNTQINHADIAAYVTPFNHAFAAPAVNHALSPFTAAGRAALDGVITLQSVIISYIDDFKLLMILSPDGDAAGAAAEKARGPARLSTRAR